MSRLLVSVLVTLLTLACAAPAAADDDYVDLCIIASLDRPAYLDGEQMRLSINVVNSGTATATGVVVRSRGDLEFGPWGGLDESGPGVEVKPGGTVTVFVTAYASGADMVQRLEAVSTSTEPELSPDNNKTTVDAFVTVKQADLTVTVYGDADRDSVVDAGEPRAGVLVTLFGGLIGKEVTARTDEAGVAHFPGIAGGRYTPLVNLPKGWYTDVHRDIKVLAGTNTAVVRATLNDLTALSASITFDRDSYAPGDTARERVTLTNSGATDIVGLVAHCGPYGAENVLSSIGWGELDTMNEGGAVVRAGETRTWEFTGVVPPQAWDYGFVMLQCDFSPETAHDGPLAEARAAVPGGRGTVGGVLATEEKEPLADIKVLLLDPVSGAVRARAVSDATGHFQFPELPAGLYELRPVGPWRTYEAVFSVQIWAGQHVEFDPLTLQPGPVQGDPDEPPPTAQKSTVDVVSTPVPQAAPAPRPANLADTGADVRELSAIGLLLVLAGAGLLLVRRRSVS
jgi:LPXTG-motif cell wall-anchored protein